MMTKEVIADLLIQPCPNDPSVTTIYIPSKRGYNSQYRPPLTINFETLKTYPDTYDVITEEFTSLLRPDISAIFGFGRERCSEIIQGISERLGIFGGQLSVFNNSSDYITEELIFISPGFRKPEKPFCAFVTGMVLDLDLVAKSTTFLREQGFLPTLLVALVDIENQRTDNALKQFGLGYKSLVSATDLMERPKFKETFGDATPKYINGSGLRQSSLTVRSSRVLKHLGSRNPK